ncbi:MAG: 23S rRNA pseudouridine(2604) synthase RluF [Rikenellaceae bacterium]
MEVRLNKFISDSGYCSRREADRFIERGVVRINGKVAQMGTKVGRGDEVKVNGNLIECDNDTVILALNKPVGIVSTTDSGERDNIVDFVNYPTRIFNIGRLDKPSEGLILLTNDGDIVNKILRAANNHEKEYEVAVDKPITEEFLQRMANGVPILGVTTKKCKITQEGINHFRIILTQGLNRQIRRMCEALGYEVTRLRRMRIMNISLGKLPVGQWRELEAQEMAELAKSLESSDNNAKTKTSTAKPSPKPSDKPGAKPSAKPKPKSAAKFSAKPGAKFSATKSRPKPGQSKHTKKRS